MEYYLLPYIFLLFFSAFYFPKGRIARDYFLYLLFCSMPALLIMLLRGDVGTDKGYYQTIMDSTIHGDFDKVSYEIGFKYLTVFLSLFSKNVDVIIALVGLLTSVFLIRGFSENKYAYLIFVFVVFPYFYYDMTMNGLRYGLSFALSALATAQLGRQKTIYFYLLALCAISVQYSSFIILMLVFIYHFKMKKQHLLFLLVGVFIIFKMVDISYFDNKVDAYSDLVRPSGISGLSPLIVFLIIFGINKLICKNIPKFFYIILLLEVLSFFLSLKSYSGLRFQNLFIFSLLIFIVNFGSIPKLIPGNKIFLLFLVGSLCLSLKIRNFMNEDALVETPFLPYEFYWEK